MAVEGIAAAPMMVVVSFFVAPADLGLGEEEEGIPLEEAEQMLLHPFASGEVAGVVVHLGIVAVAVAAEMYSSCYDLR